MGGIMTKTNNKLWYDTGKTKIAIDLHTTPSDFYTNEGLPIQLKNGTVVYAPYVVEDDINRTPIKVQTEEGIVKTVGSTSVSSIQQYDFNKTVEIRLRGSTTQVAEYETFSFLMPYNGKIHLNSKILGGQNGWGYSGDSWQRAYFRLFLDGQKIHEVIYRRSQGMGWKNFYNNYIELEGGLHILKLQLEGWCSSKDSHLTQCKAWYNTFTLEGYNKYVYETNGTFTPPKDFTGQASITCYGGGGASTAISLYKKPSLTDKAEFKGYVTCDGNDGEITTNVVTLEQKDYPIVIGEAGVNPKTTEFTYEAWNLEESFPANVKKYSEIGTNGGNTSAFGLTAKGGTAAEKVSVLRENNENFTYSITKEPTETTAENGGTANLVTATKTDENGQSYTSKEVQLISPKKGKVVIQLLK